MNRVIATIWWGMLVATVAAVVPVAVTLLSKALDAARNIERYTAEALDGGVKIAGNTANIAALKDTISVAPQLLGAAGSLLTNTTTIASALAPVAASDASSEAVGGDSNAGKGNGRVASEEVAL